MTSDKMTIRKAVKNDLPHIFEIYARARIFMAENGNPNQWGDIKPRKELVESDIEKGISYVCEKDGEILGVFAFIYGEDPTYKVIYDGGWLNDKPYAVIHRIASSGKVKGTGEFCLKWALSQYPNVRIDTHKDNTVMRHLMDKLGFAYCGIIHLEDGDERLAFQKTI